MKKYKLLYFVSEDEYLLSHKIDLACSALKNNFEVLVVCNFLLSVVIYLLAKEFTKLDFPVLLCPTIDILYFLFIINFI